MNFWNYMRNLFDKASGKPEKVTKVEDTSLIRHFEGKRLKAYQDSVGVWTIGYGHTTNVKPGQVITEDEAEELLRFDLEWVEKAILRNVDVPLTQEQFDALATFIYNLGETNFRRSTLLKKLNREDYAGAANEFPKWNKAGGRVLRGLVRRREAEKKLFLSGTEDV